MSYRAKVSTLGTPRRAIALSTHLNSPIANETCPPDLAPTPGQRAALARLAAMYPTMPRPPTTGYNCFGCVFALRRTAIFDDSGTDIDRILFEDGFSAVENDEARPGDVVLYSDERGHTHVGRVERFEDALVLAVGAASKVAIVLSKLSDFSGEHEHKIDDERWAEGIVGKLQRVIYRDRSTTPRVAPGGRWRAIVTGATPP